MSRVYVRGPAGEQEVPLEGASFSIGRAEENDLRVLDPEASRHHCKILRSDGLHKLVDLGSRNGTVVNGRRVQWKVLVPGDSIRIGATEIVFGRRPQEASEGLSGRVAALETGASPAVRHAQAPDGKDSGGTGSAGPDAGPGSPLLSGAITVGPAAGRRPPASGDVPADRAPGLPGVEGAPAAEPGRMERTSEIAAGSQGHIIRLRRLLDLNRAINSELELKRLLERIIDAAIEVTGAERGFLVLRDPDSEELKIRVSRNIDRETIRRAETKVSHSVLRRVIESGQTIVIDDAAADRRFKASDSVIDLNLAAIVAAPLRTRSETIGAIYLDNRFRETGFTWSDRDLLEIVVDQAAIALENARLFEENLAKQRELAAAKREVEKLNRALEARVHRQDAELQEVRTQLHQTLPPLAHSYPKIVTRSPRMHEVLAVIDRIVEIDAPVHIEGESGTGKELIARAIHELGPRKHRPFVAQNCAAVPLELMESEFFGHVRGAFTGADRDKPGLFEVASGGTLFLDEIGELHLDLQSKFLRVLQSGELRRVGDKASRKVDVRVISATNRDLRKLCADGTFREDLYYRVVVIHVKLPPLRDRKEDISLLVPHFLQAIAKRTRQPVRRCSEEALEVLTRFGWPGNVRQLQNELERAVALSKDTIDPTVLSRDVRAGQARWLSPPRQAVTLDTLELKQLVRRAQVAVEREAIVEALRRGKTKTAAARLLGVSRPTLDAKIDRYDIAWQRRR